MRKKLKLFINNKYIKIIIYPLLIIVNYYRFHIVSDANFVKKMFKRSFGYKLDLENPTTLNEKIQWLKLYDRTNLHTICADKLKVREYITEKIGQEYLVPLIFKTKNPKDITSENLPDYPVVVKTNHSCGTIHFIKDKSKINWRQLQNEIKKDLKNNLYYKSKEWQYKNIPPTIIVENLLIGKEGQLPYDYKFHCFNGKVNMIQVDSNRGKANHARNWYNTGWKREPYKWSSYINGRYTDPSEVDIEKPQELEKMIMLSETLANPFLYVRVDWYIFKDKIYFGELTFHHDSGIRKILPKMYDRILGDKLDLNKK